MFGGGRTALRQAGITRVVRFGVPGLQLGLPALFTERTSLSLLPDHWRISSRHGGSNERTRVGSGSWGGGLVAQIECPPDFSHWENNSQPAYLPQTNSMVTLLVQVPGTCPNDPCVWKAQISVSIWTPGGPDVPVQACQTITGSSRTCGWFPIPFDPALPVHTQHAAGPVDWTLRCGTELKQSLEMWDGGVFWIPFVSVEMTCGGCPAT